MYCFLNSNGAMRTFLINSIFYADSFESRGPKGVELLPIHIKRILLAQDIKVSNEVANYLARLNPSRKSFDEFNTAVLTEYNTLKMQMLAGREAMHKMNEEFQNSFTDDEGKEISLASPNTTMNDMINEWEHKQEIPELLTMVDCAIHHHLGVANEPKDNQQSSK